MSIVGIGDLATLGQKLVEMCDRVARIDPVVPGAVAKWGFDIDGKSFEVAVKVAKK